VTVVALSVFLPFCLAAFLPSVAAQGGGGRGAMAPTNLQVLPKDMPAQEVTALMQGIAQSLGVQCNYCHVQAPVEPPAEDAPPAAGRGRGQGPPPFNFAADDKPEKKTARMMLKMVDDINARLAAELGKPAADLVRVQCVTCHRGVTQPKQLAEMLSQTMLGKGDSAAVALYRDFRTKYYGTQAYDFREPVLVGLAQQSLANNKPDDAMTWLQLNIEFYPKFVPSYITLAEIHLRKKDPEAAIKDLEKALALDPDNAQAKRQLAALKK
jgi:hypothetical protein